jgi:hypothetical protein
MGDFRFEVWPTEHRHITQHFGANPQNYAQFRLPGHDGVDIRAPAGSKVFCVAPGRVYQVRESPTGHNYGIHVRVAHQDGYKTVYAHLERALVREGQIVEAGTLLGLADNTGNSFGHHLHITLKKDGAGLAGWPYDIVNPTPFLLPLLGWQKPVGPFVEGWVLLNSVMLNDELAQANSGGATLHISPDRRVLIPAGTIVIALQASEPFLRVQVARVAVGLDDEAPPKPDPEPSAMVVTVDGWAWRYFLKTVGNQAVVGPHGVDLRMAPSPGADNIGIVKANSTVTVLGPAQDRYLPVRAKRNDFQGPVQLPEPPPDPALGPSDEVLLGWALSQYLSPMEGRRALTSRLGVNLRSGPDESGQNIGLVKAFATVSVAGEGRQGYTPILVRRGDVLNVVSPLPDVIRPDPLPDEPLPEPEPPPTTTPGWAFTNGLYVSGSGARVSRYGVHLRQQPRRDADKIGFIPADTALIVTGPARGEYTPVRVVDGELQPPKVGVDAPGPDDEPLGHARLGLHASADPHISEAEHGTFKEMRPGLIKVLSFHPPADIRRLAQAHPDAHWVVRAFLSFGGRNIRPEQFISDTVGDVRRTLAELKGRQVVVELHNEPNTVLEGLGSAWTDGATFSAWFRELLRKYRQVLPGARFLYPGLSPGATVTGVKMDHIRFLETGRAAVEEADGAGVHAYWSNVFGMERALEWVDDYISRFRDHPLWVTEASRNDGALASAPLAQEYLRFWRALQTRPVVQGVTYFVASASNPQFAHEIWVGKGIAPLIGLR